jgi:hypothetical protein
MWLLGYRYPGLGAVMAFLNDAGSNLSLPSNSLGASPRWTPGVHRGFCFFTAAGGEPTVFPDVGPDWVQA